MKIETYIDSLVAYKNTPAGKEAFRRFAAWVNQQ